jgi:hypothetical protein
MTSSATLLWTTALMAGAASRAAEPLLAARRGALLRVMDRFDSDEGSAPPGSPARLPAATWCAMRALP